MQNKYHNIFMPVFIVISFLILNSNLVAEVNADSLKQIQDEKLTNALENETLADGKYTGESLTWTGMKVEVEVKDGKLSSIKILEVNGTPEYYDPVVKRLPRRMKKKNHFQVDGISGATLSCKSCMKAVRIALLKAIKE